MKLVPELLCRFPFSTLTDLTLLFGPRTRKVAIRLSQLTGIFCCLEAKISFSLGLIGIASGNLTSPPKLSIFGWKCLHDGLPLGADLLKKHFNIDGPCPFGCENIENETHLFLECPMTRTAWFCSSMAFKSDRIPISDFKTWLSHCFQDCNSDNRSVIIQMIWFCWAIYSHRNEVLFNNTQPSPGQIVDIWNREAAKTAFFSHACY